MTHRTPLEYEVFLILLPPNSLKILKHFAYLLPNLHLFICDLSYGTLSEHVATSFITLEKQKNFFKNQIFVKFLCFVTFS